MKKIGEISELNEYKIDPSIQEAEDEQDAVIPVMLSDKQRMYSLVYHGLTTRFGFSPIENLLVATIISLSRKYGYCTASQGTFANILNVSTPTIISAMKNLESKGIIEKTGKKSRYGTHELKVSKKVADYLEYLQEQIALKQKQNKERKMTYKESL